MSYSIWLFLVALSGWAAGYIVGGKGFGMVADICFGLTGGMAVRFLPRLHGRSRSGCESAAIFDLGCSGVAVRQTHSKTPS